VLEQHWSLGIADSQANKLLIYQMNGQNEGKFESLPLQKINLTPV
jgi:hypothetical protein